MCGSLSDYGASDASMSLREVLTRTGGSPLSAEAGSKYRIGTGKLMHMMKWTRNDVLNRVRGLSRFMADPTSLHLKRMHQVMDYI
jgi:hypothetical protein